MHHFGHLLEHEHPALEHRSPQDRHPQPMTDDPGHHYPGHLVTSQRRTHRCQNLVTVGHGGAVAGVVAFGFHFEETQITPAGGQGRPDDTVVADRDVLECDAEFLSAIAVRCKDMVEQQEITSHTGRELASATLERHNPTAYPRCSHPPTLPRASASGWRFSGS